MPRRAAFASSSSIQRGADSAPCSTANGAESIESVGLDPEVRVGKAATQLRRIDEQVECAVHVPPRLGDQAQPAEADALPAGVADLAADGKSVLEARFRGVHVAEGEIDLGAEGLRPRDERRHPASVDFVQSLIQHMDRILDLASQKVVATEHGQGHGERLA